MGKKVVTASGKVMSLAEAEAEKNRKTTTGKALKQADREYAERKR